jgi:Anti-sigma-K factor rskA
VSQQHERIEELLAGYTLLALEGEDAAEADRLLAEHVPSCLACQRTLSEFRELAGDLALAARPSTPPDLVLARIRRGMDVPMPRPSSRRGAFVALAASLVGLVAMSGLSFVMAGRASRADERTSTALEVLAVMQSPQVSPFSVEPAFDSPVQSGFTGVPAPDFRRLYLTAGACPDPAQGYAYQLWLGSEGTYVAFGPMFTPADGVVLLELTVDVSLYDEVLITQEEAGSSPQTPAVHTGPVWRSPLP